MPILKIQNVSKFFYRSAGQMLLRQRLAHFVKRFPKERFYALRDISFAIEQGESLGIMGHNGAGKSTLLNIATCLCTPNEGAVTVNGRVAALLELGSGFHPDLTGAENVRINAALLGLTRRQERERFEEIVEFSELQEVIDEPLRTYSSGMIMRLAFSVAINVDPDILIIDEVLGVGDQRFAEKCSGRILKFRDAGKAMMVVSHSLETLKKLCDRGLWLDHGRVARIGPIPDVIEAYKEQGLERAIGSGR